MRSFLPHFRTLSALAFGLPIAFTSSMLAGCDLSGSGSPAIHPNLTELRSEWIVTPEEAYRWASVKNDNLPTLTGSQEWLNYMRFLEKQLAEYGAVDGVKNSWQFER
ncbi:MAG: hypothetical protein VW865_13595, partial [Halieaceae bacterium]